MVMTRGSGELNPVLPLRLPALAHRHVGSLSQQASRRVGPVVAARWQLRGQRQCAQELRPNCNSAWAEDEENLDDLADDLHEVMPEGEDIKALSPGYDSRRRPNFPP